MNYDDLKKIKKIFQEITNPNRQMDAQSVERRVEEIRWLEKTMRTDFDDTRDFRRKINACLSGHDFRREDITARLISARKKLNLTQRGLGDALGYSNHSIIGQVERGSRMPSPRIKKWLKKCEMVQP